METAKKTQRSLDVRPLVGLVLLCVLRTTHAENNKLLTITLTISSTWTFLQTDDKVGLLCVTLNYKTTKFQENIDWEFGLGNKTIKIQIMFPRQTFRT